MLVREEATLITRLLTDKKQAMGLGDTLVRPVIHASDTVNVAAELKLLQVTGMDEDQQAISIQMVYKMVNNISLLLTFCSQ